MHNNNWRNLAAALAVAIASLFFVGNVEAQVAETTSHQISWQSANPNIYPPALDGETLFVNGQRAIEAWDTTTGKLRWSHALKSPAVFQPRIADELLVVSGRHDISIRDKQNGKIRWTLSAQREFSVPLIYQEMLVIGDGDLLKAMSLNDGTQLWQFKTSGNARIGYAPVGYGENILLAAGNGVLYSLTVNNGKVNWQVDRYNDWQYLRQLDISNGVLVAGGYHDEMFGIDPDNGNIKWRFVAGNFINSELVSDGVVYFWSPTGWIYALNSTDGKQRWRHRTINWSNPGYPGSWSSIMAEIEADDDYLYILAMDDVLHKLDKRSGEEVACFTIGHDLRPFVIPSPGGQEFIFGTKMGELIKRPASELKRCRFIFRE
ncbi:MAG: PQQ-binding-like beta-propeller repeat protein [Gammaproteobacteria bacterium]|nr:PQQ-binding-like beta-propeller repeat protein [Gammaproteobacteria bacterium]